MSQLRGHTIDICHLNRWLRFQFRCQLIGAPPPFMVAKYRLCSLQDNLLKTIKGNPSRETLLPLVVCFSPLLFNLLVTQVNLLFNKASLVSNKVTLLDKLVNRMFTQTKLISSMVQHLDKLVNRMVHPPSSIVKHLGKLASLKSNQANQLPGPLGHLVRQDNPQLCNNNSTPSKYNLLGRWANLNIN